MLKERLQILVDRDQRRRLNAEAKRRGVSVGSVVREAIDHSIGGTPRARRVEAVAEMRRAPAVRYVAPEKLAQLLDERELPVDPGTVARAASE